MPDLRITERLSIPEAELSWRFSRSSGPGGQGVNTTDSRVELTVDIADCSALQDFQRTRALQRLASRLVEGRLTVVASEHRSQLRNREAAAARMAALLADAIAPPAPARRPTRPSHGARERRLAGKKTRSQVKALRRPPASE